MNVLVYLGKTVRGRSLGVAHYATNLIHSLVARPDTNVGILGTADAIATYEDVPEVRLIDENGIDTRRSVIRRDCDVLVQIHQFQPRLLDVPTVLVVHDLHVYDIGWKYGKGRHRLVRSLHKNVIRADAVVSHFSHTVKRLLDIEPLAVGKTFLTDCPSLIDDYDLDGETIASVERRFQLDDDLPTILYPAQLQLHKNHWNLLNALNTLASDGYRARLICTGSTASPQSWAMALEQRVEYLGLQHVHFPGYVLGTDLRALYHLATAVVSTSLAEGGAYIAQEALLHNTPVACSAIPAAIAHLDRMRLKIPIFDPFDIDELVQVLKQLIDDPQSITNSYGQAEEIVSSWTWDRLADDILTSVDKATQ